MRTAPLIALSLIPTALLLAACAPAQPLDPSPTITLPETTQFPEPGPNLSPDARFALALGSAHVPNVGDPNALCKSLSEGDSPQTVMSSLTSLTSYQQGVFLGNAVSIYCPQYSPEVKSFPTAIPTYITDINGGH